MVSWYVINIDAQNSIQVLPEVRLERVPVVCGHRLWTAIPAQPGPDEGITAVKGRGCRHWHTFQPMALSIQNRQKIGHAL